MVPSYEKESFYASVITLIALSLISAFFTFFPITNTDIWWHLASARELISKRHILYTDPFAFTLRNPAWINIHWLYQLVLFMLFRIFGVGGLIIIKCLAVACVCLLVSLTLPVKRYIVITAAAFTVLLFDVRYLILVRPVIITILCLALYMWAFEHYIRTRKAWYLWMLLPIQVIWTNSQGLFPLGIAIAGCYVLGETMQRIVYVIKMRLRSKIEMTNILPLDLVMIFCLLIVSSFLNPYGWQGFMFPMKLLQRIDPTHVNIFSQNISENMPLFKLAGKDAHHIYAVVVATLICLYTFWINKRAFRWAHLLIFGIFLVLACMAKRNILLYFTILPVIIGFNIVYGSEKGSARP